MKISFLHKNQEFSADLSKPIDLSLSIGHPDKAKVKCYYAADPVLAPVTTDSFVGSMAQGFSVNYYTAQITPHGNGTHTECIGHISNGMERVSDVLGEFHFVAKLISITPKVLENQDKVISKSLLKSHLPDADFNALIIRTLPNFSIKKTIDYSGTNPCYFTAEALEYLAEIGIQHLLVDLPSVDRESDGGKLAAHHAFWKGDRKKFCTITELIYAPNEIEDDIYLLNLQLSTIELDAAPSRPVIFKLNKE